MELILRTQLFILFLVFFIAPAYACIPCNKESVVIINKQAKPKFPKSYTSELQSGEVTFTVDVMGTDKIKNIKILSMSPSTLPKESIIKMINSSKFLLKSTIKGKAFIPCSFKGFEYTFEFQLPQKITFDLDL